MSCSFSKCVSWMLGKFIALRNVIKEWRGRSHVVIPCNFSIQKSYRKMLEVQPKVQWGKLLIKNIASPKNKFIDILVKWGVVVNNLCALCGRDLKITTKGRSRKSD